MWAMLASRMYAQCGNPIACENQLTGNPQTEWDIVESGDPTIQGYGTDISVNRGQTISFKVNTTASAYRIDIYRLGYYAGRGARKVATINPSVSLPQVQPQCLRDASTGLVDCGNWAVSASWPVPSAATSGVYIARLVRTDTGGASHITFVVRDDAGNSDMLFQTSDLTWQAYNSYGGCNVYDGYGGNGPGPFGRAYKVSYNRPFNTRTASFHCVSFLFGSEYPMIRWLEANGYNVSYASGLDSDRRGSAALKTHKIFLSVGHDEYWSGGQRANVQAARDAGVHLGFFSGNEMFWKTRWENSMDGSNTPYRTLVCYKETHANARIDPTPAWTGTWRDPRFSPPADGGKPENALIGQMFTVNSFRHDPMLISANEGKLRLWRNTGLDTLGIGQTAQLPAGVLGYEWDEALDNGLQPPGLIRFSTTTILVDLYLQDYGSTYAPAVATHNLTLYRHSSGALVFAAGTTQWSWGLDAVHDVHTNLNSGTYGPVPAADPRMQQATVNLFADMGIQPKTLRPGLTAATPPSNSTAPNSTISAPLAGATVSLCGPVTISGTASANGGTTPAAVDFSTDGGATWQRAIGATNWTATWTPTAPGLTTIKTRAINDSGRIEIPGLGTPFTVIVSTCPASSNVALASAGAVASASSIYGPGYPTAAVNDNERAGINAGNGGMWADSTENTYPDWVEIAFNGKKTINRAVIYTLQDNLSNLVEPSDTMTFTSYGVVDFTVQGWNGASWVVLGTVTGNNLVKRTVTFPPFNTDRVRVNVSKALTTFSRIIEFEAWGFDIEASAPVFSPVPGTYSTVQTVTLQSSTPGAQIYYTTNGSTPTTASTRYTAPIAISSSTTIKAIAVAAGANNSLVSTGSYTIQGVTQAIAPTFTPDSGTYSTNQSVALSSLTTGAQIYYTTNGSTPTTSSTRYTAPIPLTAPATIKAIAVATGLTNSAVVSAIYSFQAASPIFSPAGGTYTSAQSVQLSDASPGAKIYYTTNGTTPTTSSALYSGAIPISATTTVNAIAAVTGWTNSTVATATYTISTQGGTLPAAPSNLVATTASANQINLTWTDASNNESNFKLERKTGAGGTYAQIATPAANTNSYSDAALSSAITYYYRLRATNVTGDSAYSNEANATTATAGTLPAPWIDRDIGATGLAGSASYSGGVFTVKGSGADIWNAADAFNYVSQPMTGNAEIIARVTSVQNTDLWAKAGLMIRESLAPGAEHAMIALTPGNGLAFQRRVSTGGASATTAGAAVTASYWIRLVRQGDTFTGYGSSDGLSWLQVGSASIAMVPTVYVGLAVTSHNNALLNQSAFDNVFLTTEPAPPSGLAATASSSSQINLTWTDNASNESGFKIERRLGAGGTYAQVAAVAAGVTAYSNTGLTPGTTYYYRVRSSNVAADSAYSNEASATTSGSGGVPAAPATLSATAASSSQINLSWSDVANETGFKIERKTGSGGTYSQIATTGAGVITYSNTGLSAGTAYFYRVRATNATGDSPYSPEASATTSSIPSFRAASSAGATSGILSLSINKPTGTQQGDVMVAAIAVRPSTATINAAGWTLVRRVDNSAGNSNSLAVYYKVAGPSEPASYTWTFNSSSGSAGGIRSFSGIDNTNPVDLDAGQNTASGLAHAAPSITTRFANDMVVTSHAFASSAAFTPPGGMTEAYDVASNSPGSSGVSNEGCYLLQAAVGATGTRAANAANDADTGNAHTLALRAR